jgi:hypothetical protein
MDLSVFEVTRETPNGRFIGIGGVATDDVATVVLKGANGAVLAKTPVVSNTYEFASVPNVSVKTMEALDSSGDVIWSQVVGGA